MRNAVDTGLVYGSLAALLVETDDLLEPVEKPLLDVLRFAADAAQLTERLPLFLRQVRRDDDSHIDDLVATPTRTQVRDPAPMDAKQLAILGTRRDLDSFRPVHRGNLDGVAQRSLRHAERQVVDDIGAIALQNRVWLDLDHDVQVAGRATTWTDLTLAREPDLGARVHASRGVDPNFLLTGTVAGAAADAAGSLDHLSLTIAAGATRDVDDLAED